MTSPTERIGAIALKLASSKVRYITDLQIGAYRRQYGATRDEVRAAAIMADRMRRQTQIAQNRPTFAVHAIVGPEAPIELPTEKIARERRKARE
nr:hypothetical protein [uncultured Shinella sp.]